MDNRRRKDDDDRRAKGRWGKSGCPGGRRIRSGGRGRGLGTGRGRGPIGWR